MNAGRHRAGCFDLLTTVILMVLTFTWLVTR